MATPERNGLLRQRASCLYKLWDGHRPYAIGVIWVFHAKRTHLRPLTQHGLATPHNMPLRKRFGAPLCDGCINVDSLTIGRGLDKFCVDFQQGRSDDAVCFNQLTPYRKYRIGQSNSERLRPSIWRSSEKKQCRGGGRSHQNLWRPHRPTCVSCGGGSRSSHDVLLSLHGRFDCIGQRIAMQGFYEVIAVL